MAGRSKGETAHEDALVPWNMGEAMTRDQVVAAIRKLAGQDVFSVTFVKADGSTRVMRCRYCEVEPVKQHREPSNVIVVWDVDRQAYRSFLKERLTHLRMDGKCEEIS